MPNFTGAVARSFPDDGGLRRCGERSMRALQLSPALAWSDERMVSFDAANILVTTPYLPIDPSRQLAYLNQTYTDAERMFPLRIRIADERFALQSDPLPVKGRHVIIGGPFDKVWYHWLFSWCPRFLLLRWLRPDVFDDPATRFVVHPWAMNRPYLDVLETFAIPPERISPIGPKHDYLFEEACLVSFPDQNKLYPELIHGFARHLKDAFAVRDRANSPRRIFASRQAIAPPKRRIHNFEAVAPILEGLRVAVSSLGDLPAREQADLFHNADLVVGGHGSDLSNLLFCRAGTRVLVLESALSIGASRHIGLKRLCEVLELEYHCMVTPTIAGARDVDTALGDDALNRDYLVDPAQLAARIAALC